MKVSLDHPPVLPISLWVNAASRSRYYYSAIVQYGRQNSDTDSSARLNASYVHQSGRKLLAGGPLGSVLAVHLDMLFVSDVRMKCRVTPHTVVITSGHHHKVVITSGHPQKVLITSGYPSQNSDYLL